MLVDCAGLRQRQSRLRKFGLQIAVCKLGGFSDSPDAELCSMRTLGRRLEVMQRERNSRRFQLIPRPPAGSPSRSQSFLVRAVAQLTPPASPPRPACPTGRQVSSQVRFEVGIETSLPAGQAGKGSCLEMAR